MAIRFSCPSCQRKISARDEYAETRAKCPGCGIVLNVPPFSTDWLDDATADVPPAIQEGRTTRQIQNGPRPSFFCRTCSHGVSFWATTCPKCGAPSPSISYSTYIIGAFIAIVLSFAFIEYFVRTEPAIKDLVNPTYRITMAQYNRLQNGMSYSEVVAILGMEGTEISSNRMDAIPGVMEQIDTVMYQWDAGGIANMNAMFQNDRLITKAQFGLK